MWCKAIAPLRSAAMGFQPHGEKGTTLHPNHRMMRDVRPEASHQTHALTGPTTELPLMPCTGNSDV
jgi:hypothetical protein